MNELAANDRITGNGHVQKPRPHRPSSSRSSEGTSSRRDRSSSISSLESSTDRHRGYSSSSDNPISASTRRPSNGCPREHDSPRRYPRERSLGRPGDGRTHRTNKGRSKSSETVRKHLADMCSSTSTVSENSERHGVSSDCLGNHGNNLTCLDTNDNQNRRYNSIEGSAGRHSNHNSKYSRKQNGAVKSDGATKQNDATKQNGAVKSDGTTKQNGAVKSDGTRKQNGATKPKDAVKPGCFTLTVDEDILSTLSRSTTSFDLQDENEERGNWHGTCDFNVSVLGFAVGLDNVWRFPYLCYRNGGGAFLFPYIIMMILVGLPLFFLEAALGQYTSCGATMCWNFAPLFKGVGIAMVMVSAMTGIYYNVLLSWAFHYLFASFTSDPPFLNCDNPWNTEDCSLRLPTMQCQGVSKTMDGLCRSYNGTEVGIWNKTLFVNVTGRKLKSPSQEYWENSVLEVSEGLEHMGSPKWDLVLCLMLAWAVCFFCLIKGIKSTGKVVYFTALCPYVLLIILFLRGLTLEHASYGIYYFITPSFERLGDATAWKDAINQIFFSLGIAGGSVISLASYNRFHNNIVRDSILVAFGDTMTCILGGFVIFSYLGYIAGQLSVHIEDVAVDGVGLAFVMYPEAISNLPPTTLWAILFFVTLLTLGLDSQFVMIETVLTGVIDQFPMLRHKKMYVMVVICVVLFLFGLPLTCPGGIYLLQLMDNYVGGMTLFIIAAFELVAVVFVYGVNRFCLDIRLMTNCNILIFWKITWCIVSPITIAFIFIFIFVDYHQSRYDDYIYPRWADALGWVMTLGAVMAIPLVMVYKIYKAKDGSNVFQKIRMLCTPTIRWGPALKKHRVKVDYVDDFHVEPHKKLPSLWIYKTLFPNYFGTAVKTEEVHTVTSTTPPLTQEDTASSETTNTRINHHSRETNV
ncbi:sodium- and chloride-dependent glycine transporter 1-like [Physella acuta]|uniref:sodium- and chloride-dependent glycine transporter 1-like n=1 Tax=Physella acuta TaxID=109671 RepID=UPI0027DCA76D|nr:sodium- and chloride-dependent glycine transporter 1-like [Physella acuta]